MSDEESTTELVNEEVELVALTDDEPDEHDDILVAQGDAQHRGGAPWLAAILALPAKVAVGVLSILAGAGAARRAGASTPGATLSGAISAVALQAVLFAAHSGDSRRREIEDARARDADSHGGVGWGEAVQAVAQMVQRFSEGLSVPAGLRYLLMLDRKLVLLYHRETAARLARRARWRGVRSPARVLELGRRYCKFAMATYGYTLLRALGMLEPGYDWREHGTRTIDVARHHLQLDASAVLVTRLDGEVIGVPRHLVAVDDATRAVVVAIRGTSSMADLITDLLCEAAPFGAGFAHAGMRDAAAALLAAITPTLRTALAARPGHSLVVCGHSLGAGVALLLTKMLLDTGLAPVKCYAFAPCPVFGPRRRVDTDWSDSVECFVHHEDIVAQLCLSSARRLALEIERIDALSLEPADRRRLDESADDRRRLAVQIDKQRRAARRSDPREHVVQHLYIPTRTGVHWMLPDENEGEGGGWRFWRKRKPVRAEDLFPDFPWSNWNIPRANRPARKYSSYITDVSSFERLLVTPRSIASHFPSKYVSAFASLPIRPAPQPPIPATQPNKLPELYFGELGLL